ncbi:MAG TPA: hypothetical protein VNI83_02130 [Vicinamibacterales bacterium]|nr:hypothetical protein [Vicinamibacterales bacterium]
MPYEAIKVIAEEEDVPSGNGPIAELVVSSRSPRPAQGESLSIVGARLMPKLTAANENTAGNVTYTTAQLAGGLITRDPNGLARTDVVPNAVDIINDLGLGRDGDTFICYFINTADAAETVTFGGTPTGVTYANAGQTIAQNESAILLFRRTSPTTVTMYIVGA